MRCRATGFHGDGLFVDQRHDLDRDLRRRRLRFGATAYVGHCARQSQRWHAPDHDGVECHGYPVEHAGGLAARRAEQRTSALPQSPGARPTPAAPTRSRRAGADIWGTADQFQFVYKPMTGNGEVIARVASITNANAWSKAGVMIRESLRRVVPPRDGRDVDQQGIRLSAAAGDGCAAACTRRAGPEQRRDGCGWCARATCSRRTVQRTERSWTRIGSDTIPMADTVYVGLAATSHNVSTATTAVVNNFRVNTTSAGNQLPSVNITAPGNGAVTRRHGR